VAGRRVIVGVSGGSGSGKTTFCEQLVARLGKERVLHLKQDSYYRDLSHLTQEARDQVNFDHPQALEFGLLSEHLKVLQNGQSVQVPVYDFATHTRSRRSQFADAKPVIVIEGILIFSQSDIFEQLDYSIFVDAPETVRLARRIRRDISERGRTKESVEKQFFATVAPMHDLFVEPSKSYCQSIISGEAPFEHTIENLMRKLLADSGS
jgi:uridine kinase